MKDLVDINGENENELSNEEPEGDIKLDELPKALKNMKNVKAKG